MYQNLYIGSMTHRYLRNMRRTNKGDDYNMSNNITPYIILAIGAIIVFATFALAEYLDQAQEEHEEDYGLVSVVTTTSEYEYLTNDSFTGVVVRGEGGRDPVLTVRNRDGVERMIATEFLIPV